MTSHFLKKIIAFSFCSILMCYVFILPQYVLAETCTFGPDYDPKAGVATNCKPDNVPNITLNKDMPFTSIQTYVMEMLQRILPFAAVVAILFIVISGIRMVTHSYNEAEAKKAEKGMLYAAVGLLAILLAYAVVTALIRLVYRVGGL